MNKKYLFISAIGKNPSNESVVRVERRTAQGIAVKEFGPDQKGTALKTSDAAILLDWFLRNKALPKAIYYLCSKTGPNGDKTNGTCVLFGDHVETVLDDVKQWLRVDKQVQGLYAHLLQLRKNNLVKVLPYGADPRSLSLDVLTGVWGESVEILKRERLEGGIVVNVTRGPKSLTTIIHYIVLTLQPLMEALGNKAELTLYYQHNIFKGRKSSAFTLNDGSDTIKDFETAGLSVSSLYNLSYLFDFVEFAESLRRFYKRLDLVDFIKSVERVFKSYEVDLLQPYGANVLERCRILFGIAPYSVYPYLLTIFINQLGKKRVVKTKYKTPEIKRIARMLRDVINAVLEPWLLDLDEPYFGDRAMYLRLKIVKHLVKHGYIANAMLLYGEFVVDLLIYLYLRNNFRHIDLKNFDSNMFLPRLVGKTKHLDDHKEFLWLKLVKRLGFVIEEKEEGIRKFINWFLNTLADAHKQGVEHWTKQKHAVVVLRTGKQSRVYLHPKDLYLELYESIEKLGLRRVLVRWTNNFRKIRNTIAHGGNTAPFYQLVFGKARAECKLRSISDFADLLRLETLLLEDLDFIERAVFNISRES